MTKEGFLIPSPTKHTTSWSSSNTATTMVVGGVICHEIMPPEISPVLPITKNQGTPVKKAVLPHSDDAKKDSTNLEEKLAIQAPDVSSTEETSGPERDLQDEQDKDSHVTSSRLSTQESDTVAKEEIQNAMEEGNVGDSDKVENDKSTEGEISPNLEVNDRDVKSTAESKNENVAKKVKKGKKKKPIYKCHVCGSVFGKPVHVKIHIAKKHGLQARKSASKGKIFVPGKREKIRTRSVTKTVVSKPVRSLEMVADELHNQKLSEQGQEQTEMKVAEPLPPKNTQPDVDKPADPTKSGESQQSHPDEEMQINDDSVFEPPAEDNDTLEDTQFTGSLLSGSASMIPMMYSSSAYGHREGKNCGTYQCEFCHRVFRYRTWLAKHLEMKHPGKVPSVPFAEIKIAKEKPNSPVPPPPVTEEGKFVEEELTPEQIQILKDNSKGKRLKIFPCSLCGRRFSSKTNVRRHKRLIHKILVRPRRTRLPYPEYTVEEEEKPVRPSKKATIPSGQKVGSVLQPAIPHASVPETKVDYELPSSAPSPPSTGMRKPRKNKSPLKRSRAVHSQEDYAESYITFPIEPNPNPLSAFMPTKPETFELESAVYSKTGVIHKPASSIKRMSEPSTPSPASSPPHEGSQSRRTGPPPVVAASPSDANSLLLQAEMPNKSMQKTSPNLSTIQPSVIRTSASKRKPTSVTHVHPKVPSGVASSPHRAIPTVYPYMPKRSSGSHKSSPLGSKLNSLETAKSIAKMQSDLQKPSFTNPWVATLKPQPYVPKKPKTDIESTDRKKDGKQTGLLMETPVTQALSATHADVKKLDTFSVLNLKRREPTPPPPLPMSADGILDLTVRKKPRLDTPEPTPPPPKYSIPSEPLDENQPLDLSSSSSKQSLKYSVHTKDQANPTKSYASSGSHMSSESSSSYATGPKYEFHRASPPSFGGQMESTLKPGPFKKHDQTVQQMLHPSDLLMKVERDNPQQGKMQQPPPMQSQHPMQLPTKTPSYRPLLPKPSSATPSVLSPPHPRLSQTSPPPRSSTQQLSPHLVAAQVIKQAHAQSALRPILPKPVPGAATPVFIGGKVVAAGSPPKSESLLKKHSSPDGTPLDSTGFACNVCNVPFTSIKTLAKHVVMHAQEWPYKCEFCVRLYQDTDELIQHRTQLHHVGKTFSCGVCKRDFAYKSNLKKHQSDVHNLTEMNFRELGPKELRAHNFTDPAKIKTGPPELPQKPKSERPSFLEQEMKKQTPIKIGKLKLPLKTRTPSPTTSTPSPRKTGPINPQRHHPFAYARQIGYLNMLNDPRNQEVLQTVNTHRCTKCSKEFTETAEFHGHIMECALQGMDKGDNGSKEKDKNMDADKLAAEVERHAMEVSEKKMKMKAYTKSKKKAIQQRQSGVMGKRQRAKPGLKTYNPEKYTRRRSSASVDDVHACPGCDKKFYFINKLERHMRMCPNRHTFKGKKVVAESDSPVDNVVKKGHCCPFCTRQFTYLKSLKKHALVCPARNPNITDPIRLIEDNFKKAQRQMAAERHDTDAKPTDANKGESSTQVGKQTVGAKKRRKRRRTDVIPKPKKRKRVTASADLQEDQNLTTSSPRKVGSRMGAKRNTTLNKIGQQTPPKKQQETADDTAEGSVGKRKLAMEENQNPSENLEALQETSSAKVSEKVQLDNNVCVSQTSATESAKINEESINTENNNEAVVETKTTKCDETGEEIESNTNIPEEDALSKNDSDHPPTTVPSSAGNLPDQSAKKHVTGENQVEDSNRKEAISMNSTKQSSTKTNTTHSNGTDVDTERKMNGNTLTNDKTTLKAYPMRNRLQPAS